MTSKLKINLINATLVNLGFCSFALCANPETDISPPLESRTIQPKPLPIGSFKNLCTKKQFANIDTFNGYKVELNRKFAREFETEHTFLLANAPEPSSYRFSTTFTRGNYELNGKVDFDSQSDLSFRGTFDPYSFEVGTTLLTKSNLPHLNLEYEGNDWNGQLKIGKRSLLRILYFERLSPYLSLGTEFELNKWPGLHTCVQMADFDVLSKLTSENLELTYIKTVPGGIKFESRFDFDWNTKKSKLLLGAALELYKQKVLASIDGSGTFKFLVETTASENVKFVLCSDLQSFGEKISIGFGLKIS